MSEQDDAVENLMDHNPRRVLEGKYVRGLIESLERAGWKPVSYYDGGDSDEFLPVTQAQTKSLVRQVEEAVFAVDDCKVWFEKLFDVTPQRHWVYFVLGNEPHEVVNDFSCAPRDEDGFAEIVEKYQEEFEKEHPP